MLRLLHVCTLNKLTEPQTHLQSIIQAGNWWMIFGKGAEVFQAWSSLSPQKSMPKILWKPGHDGDEHIVELASSKDFSISGLTTMKLIPEFDVTWKPPPQCSTKVQADLQIAFSLPRPFPRKLHAVRAHDKI
jgi:hypothetical protein